MKSTTMLLLFFVLVSFGAEKTEACKYFRKFVWKNREVVDQKIDFFLNFKSFLKINIYLSIRVYKKYICVINS